MSKGKKAGIVVRVIVFVILLAIGLFCVWYSHDVVSYYESYGFGLQQMKEVSDIQAAERGASDYQLYQRSLTTGLVFIGLAAIDMVTVIITVVKSKSKAAPAE